MECHVDSEGNTYDFALGMPILVGERCGTVGCDTLIDDDIGPVRDEGNVPSYGNSHTNEIRKPPFLFYNPKRQYPPVFVN